MRFQYAPELVEEVIFQEIQNSQERGDVHLFNEYHALADRMYDDFSGSQREAEFEKLHRKFFVKLGFADLIPNALVEFESLSDKVEVLFVGKAISNKEEGADLSRDGKGLGLKLRTKRFFDVPFLSKFLRHELTHVADMLDERFGYLYYERLSSVSPTEDNLIRERYRVLWDISIDSRILRSGKETTSDKSARFREFAALYQKLPDDWIKELFGTLWETEHLTHHELLEMAADTQKLPARLKGGKEDTTKREGIEHELSQTITRLPGSPCPLCRFPTYVWMADLTQLTPQLQTAVREDVPDWLPEHGLCERCFEGYQARAKQFHMRQQSHQVNA